MTGIQVRHEGGDRYAIAIRGHEVHVDQPVDGGGDDSAPTPTELFVAGLASCVAPWRPLLAWHELSLEGFGVDCSYELSSDRPARVRSIGIHVDLPHGFPIERRDALLAVLKHCTVHNSIVMKPDIAIALRADPKAA
jgi:uncharacterized OsmC-like protein